MKLYTKMGIQHLTKGASLHMEQSVFSKSFMQVMLYAMKWPNQ